MRSKPRPGLAVVQVCCIRPPPSGSRCGPDSAAAGAAAAAWLWPQQGRSFGAASVASWLSTQDPVSIAAAGTPPPPGRRHQGAAATQTPSLSGKFGQLGHSGDAAARTLLPQGRLGRPTKTESGFSQSQDRAFQKLENCCIRPPPSGSSGRPDSAAIGTDSVTAVML